MTRAAAAIALVAMSMSLPIGAALADDLLPFPDGRYVTDPSICRFDANGMVDRYTDTLGRHVRIITGSTITDGYELSCDVSNVRQSGSDVMFDAACDAEGETTNVNGRYVSIASDVFALSGTVFRRCDSIPEEVGEDTSASGGFVDEGDLQEAPQNLASLSGQCDELRIGDRDMTRFCKGKLASTSYESGRVGFYFILQDGAILTLSGNDVPNPTPDTDRFFIDRMIVNLGGGIEPAMEPATGSCEYSNPFTGEPAFVRCEGESAGGEVFRASFTTDGQPPS